MNDATRCPKQSNLADPFSTADALATLHRCLLQMSVASQVPRALGFTIEPSVVNDLNLGAIDRVVIDNVTIPSADAMTSSPTLAGPTSTPS
jgi:hypothetical protein